MTKEDSDHIFRQVVLQREYDIYRIKSDGCGGFKLVINNWATKRISLSEAFKLLSEDLMRRVADA